MLAPPDKLSSQAPAPSRENPYADDKVLLPYHWQRVLQLLDTKNRTEQGDQEVLKMPSPSMVEIDLTDGGCNQGCGHCCFHSGEGEKIRQIDVEMLVTFLKEAFDDGTRAFELVGGGEPTAHRDISKVISAVAGFHRSGESAEKSESLTAAQIGIVSNGVLLHRIFPNLKRGEIEWVRVSLDSANPDTYHLMHGVKKKNHFDKVIANVREAVQLMNPNDVGLGYLVVPPYNHTREEIINGVKLAAELGVGHIAFRPFQSALPMPVEMWREAVLGIAQARELYGDRVNITGGTGGSWDFILEPETRPKGMCLIRPLVMVVQANGDIPQCFLDRENDKRPPFGNIAAGYQAAWKENPAHITTWLDVDMEECPNACKFYRGNRAAKEVITLFDAAESKTPVASSGQKHIPFI